MWVALGPCYPFEASSVYLGFREVKGLLASHVKMLEAKLGDAIGSLVGREMVFDLHTCAREFLTEHNVDHTTFSMHDQMIKEQEEKRVVAEREARAREQAMARELRQREQNHVRDQKLLEQEMKIAETERELRARELAQQEQDRLRKIFGQAAPGRNRRESEEEDSDWDGDEGRRGGAEGEDAGGNAGAIGGGHEAAVLGSDATTKSKVGLCAVAEGAVVAGDVVPHDGDGADVNDADAPGSAAVGCKKLRWKKLITQVCVF